MLVQLQATGKLVDLSFKSFFPFFPREVQLLISMIEIESSFQHPTVTEIMANTILELEAKENLSLILNTNLHCCG